MTATLIKTENLSLFKHQKNILDNINFEIKDGEFITLIGPNGAGKSTLIKALIGLVKITSGKIIKRKNLKISYTPQSFHPNQLIYISVLDFLKLNTKIKYNEILKTASEAGIDSILKKSINEISGGEMNKVLLARALLFNPDLLILDEPVQNLDVNSQVHFYKLIHDIHQNHKCAILMVSHDLHRVMRESNKVLCLYHHICCMGKPETVLKNDKFNYLFGEHMSSLTANYHHNHNHSHEH